MMRRGRRAFLKWSGIAAAASAVPLAVPRLQASQPAPAENGQGWEDVRAQFDLSADRIHMSAMLLSSHPKPVRDAIEKHRRGLDADPVTYLESNGSRLTEASRSAAASHLGLAASNIALTDSTTMGVGLVYNGLKLRSGQEILTTTEDYYVTHESIRLATERTGAGMRKLELYDSPAMAGHDEIIDRIAGEVRPSTRAVAITWVHSNTGLKMPVTGLAERLQEINSQREEDDHVLLCVDGVHGFGVEDAEMPGLGCDFLMAGCHKWLFGPRGTGIVAASERGLAAVRPTIPSFDDDAVFDAWINDSEPVGANDGPRMSPGGFNPFEHQWALAQAFEFQQEIGKASVAARTHELAAQLKEGLAEINIPVVTPRSAELSSGIVAFDIEGLTPVQAVAALRERGIIASVSPYPQRHARLTPSIRNTEAEIRSVVSEIRQLAG
jgi:selenocysteine lyase/cysteine desulfurase